MRGTEAPIGAATRPWVRRTGRGALVVLRLSLAAFLLLPAALVAVLSFSGGNGLRFPPDDWGFERYRAAASSEWLAAAGYSVSLSLPAAALAVLLALPLSYALGRCRMPGKGIVFGLGLAPLLLPGVAYAVAIYATFVRFDLVGSRLGIVVVYATLGLPFAVIILSASLSRIPAELELAAMSLGASRARAALGITARLMLPAVVAAFVLCFVAAFDDATFINFIGGGRTTLSQGIFASLRTGLDPAISAIATTLTVVVALLMGAVQLLRTMSDSKGAAR